jgi:vancomycin permeability regulator SanA
MKNLPDKKTLVVLGAAVLPQGVASPTLQRRTEWACRLFKRGGFDEIVLSGGQGRHGPAEAEVMAEMALAADIPPACLVLDRAASVTLDTAAFAAHMPDALGRQFVAVTDVYHAPRTWLAFRAYRLKVVIDSPPLGRATPLPKLIRSFVHEIPGLILYAYYFMRVRLQAGSARK